MALRQRYRKQRMHRFGPKDMLSQKVGRDYMYSLYMRGVVVCNQSR